MWNQEHEVRWVLFGSCPWVSCSQTTFSMPLDQGQPRAAPRFSLSHLWHMRKKGFSFFSCKYHREKLWMAHMCTIPSQWAFQQDGPGWTTMNVSTQFRCHFHVAEEREVIWGDGSFLRKNIILVERMYE